MTTPPLPELFGRVAAKVPEIRTNGVEWVRLTGCDIDWWWVGDVPSSMAEALVEAACVRWLLRNGCCISEATEYLPYSPPTTGAWLQIDDTQYGAPTLAHALLLAVEAVGGGGKEVNP